MRVGCTLAVTALLLAGSTVAAAPTSIAAEPPLQALPPLMIPLRPPADPARVAVATEIVALMMPPGSGRASFETGVAQSMAGLRQQMAMAPVRAALVAAGLAEGESRRFSPDTFRRLTLILDPAFDRRQRLIAETTAGAIAAVLDEQEPMFRAGMAQAYARRLSLAELGDLLAFLRTPSGRAFAPLPATIATDPAVIEQTQAVRAAFAKKVPAALEGLKDASRTLPPPRRFTDLNETDKAEILRLINAPSATKPPETPANVPGNP
jgi:hypothetical protein